MNNEKEIEESLKSCLCCKCHYRHLDDKKCVKTLMKDINKLYSKRNETIKKISALFEEDFLYYDGWALDKWYEIKDILEKEYWED